MASTMGSPRPLSSRGPGVRMTGTTGVSSETSTRRHELVWESRKPTDGPLPFWKALVSRGGFSDQYVVGLAWVDQFGVWWWERFKPRSRRLGDGGDAGMGCVLSWRLVRWSERWSTVVSFPEW